MVLTLLVVQPGVVVVVGRSMVSTGGQLEGLQVVMEVLGIVMGGVDQVVCERVVVVVVGQVCARVV